MATSPTLHDIARETQTSVSTVSRVLSGGAMANRISKDTRERVVETAKRLGYRPNLLARGLRMRKTHTVALLVSDIANPFFGQIGSLIERGLARHGYSLMLCNSAEDPDREAAYLKLVTQKGIDGLILVPLLQEKEKLMQYVPENLPVVILDRPIKDVPASVTTDQDQAARILCDTLDGAGIRKVAIVSGPRHVTTHLKRFEIVSSRFDVIGHFEGPTQSETGRNAFMKFLADGIEPQAIVCTNNSLGMGVIDSIAQIENPPVIGVFDEIPMMHVLPLPIVCVMQDLQLLAEGCVTQLANLLDGGAEKIEPLVIPARVVTNQTFAVKRFAATVGG